MTKLIKWFIRLTISLFILGSILAILSDVVVRYPIIAFSVICEIILLFCLIFFIKNYFKRIKKQKFNAIIDSEIQKYIDILSIKRSQLIYNDDYGCEKNEKWLREIDYFINNLILTRLQQEGMAKSWDKKLHYPFIVQLIESSIFNKNYAAPLSQSTVCYNIPVERMTPIEYEKYCANLLRQAGWDANTTKATGDQGADVIAKKNGICLIVQCKLYNKPVGNAAVQQANSAKLFYQANMAAVVSNQPYTLSAKQLAQSLEVLLLHHDQLLEVENNFNVNSLSNQKIFV